ncbi:hypothetical protein D9M71_649970 [compost metagenome]
MFDAGFGGFVAVDPEAVFLMQAAVFAAGGEGEGIAGGEGGTTEFCALENATSGVGPFEYEYLAQTLVVDFLG